MISRIRCTKHHRLSQLAWSLQWTLWCFSISTKSTHKAYHGLFVYFFPWATWAHTASARRLQETLWCCSLSNLNTHFKCLKVKGESLVLFLEQPEHTSVWRLQGNLWCFSMSKLNTHFKCLKTTGESLVFFLGQPEHTLQVSEAYSGLWCFTHFKCLKATEESLVFFLQQPENTLQVSEPSVDSLLFFLEQPEHTLQVSEAYKGLFGVSHTSSVWSLQGTLWCFTHFKCLKPTRDSLVFHTLQVSEA